jgi:hypothetical protein
MNRIPKAFISYSHDDREMAFRIGESLRASGIDAWMDKWEILPGDSLIQKIFSEGLAGADVFVIIVSQNSVRSNWVRQELDVALIKRIEGVARLIPLRVGDVDMPESLLPLKWIDMSGDFDMKIHDLVMAIFQVRERPPIGTPPEVVNEHLKSVGGLSPIASKLGLSFVTSGSPVIGLEESKTASELSEKLGLNPEETDDAIDELKNLGMVKTTDYFGTHPFSHSDVEPTYALFLHFKDEGLPYDPELDIKTIAAAVAAQKQVDGRKLQEITSLSPLRINRAVSYLEDYGIIKVTHEIGSSPFDFGLILATGTTRRFVEENCK